MFVPFQSIENQSRVWIYPSNRFFTEEETKLITEKAEQFADEWLSHQRTVQASATVLYNRIIVLAANESFTDVSGCSIDSSVKFIKSIEAEFNVQLFDRTQFFYIDAENQLQAENFRKIGELYQNGQLNEETLVLDLQVQNMFDLKFIEKPLYKTAYFRFLPVAK